MVSLTPLPSITVASSLELILHWIQGMGGCVMAFWKVFAVSDPPDHS